MSNPINKTTIKTFAKENELEPTAANLLMKAFGNKVFGGAKPGQLVQGSVTAFTGNPLFKVTGTPVPRSKKNDFGLTKKGQELMKKIETFFKLPEGETERNRIHTMLAGL